MTVQIEPSEAMIEAAMEAYYSAADGSPPSRLGIVAALKEATRTDSPTDAVVQKMVRVINGNLTTGISMGQAERYADEDTALAVIAALTPITDSPTDAVEAVARALCSLDIRAKRRHDTDAGKLTAMLPAAVDYAWPEYVNQAEAALAALRPSGEVERLREVAQIADELINGGGLRNNGECLMVVEKRDKSDPHYRLCDALVALRNSTDGETM